MTKQALVCASVLVMFAAAGAAKDAPAGADKKARRPTTQPAKRVIFAAPFENQTNQEQYDPAAAGMGDLVAVLLANQKHITVVERQKLLSLTAEQAKALKGLTGKKYAIAAGKLLKADTVLVGRLFLIKDKLTVSVKALDIATARVLAADQISCRPTYLTEAALQMARRLGKQMSLPLGKIDLKKIDKSPIASLHFAKAISHYYSGNMDVAIMQFMRTMDLDPDYVEAHYWMGTCYQRLGEFSHARIEFEKFLKRQPKSPKAEQIRKLIKQLREQEAKSPGLMPAPTSQTKPAKSKSGTTGKSRKDDSQK